MKIHWIVRLGDYNIDDYISVRQAAQARQGKVQQGRQAGKGKLQGASAGKGGR